MSYKSYTRNRIRRLTNKVKECQTEILFSISEIDRLEDKLKDMEKPKKYQVYNKRKVMYR